MINKIKTFIAVAVLSGTVGANAHATDLTEQKEYTPDLSKIHNTAIENIKSSNIALPEKQVTAVSSTTASSQSKNRIPTPVKTIPQTEKKPAPVESKLATAATAQGDDHQQQNTPVPIDAGPKEITVKATAYTASCEGCSGVTATGVNLIENPDAKVISVDPNVIPLGSKVFVEGYGVATAADTGGAIKGNRIDIFIPIHQAAINYGAKQVKVKILN